jgi:hypothetical protein
MSSYRDSFGYRLDMRQLTHVRFLPGPQAKLHVFFLMVKLVGIEYVHTFGCNAYVHELHDRKKLDAKARLGILVGYMWHPKSSQVFSPETSR